ncbi:conserved hypothetical protein [Thiocapsa sp. KS1]|nr:conserved hypothetical protein [Thiocapsa sp. KS1]
MKIYGIDFTSRPSPRKPITCLECCLDGLRLVAGELTEWRDFEGFEATLQRPGPWIAGIDFPFGQSRTFIRNIGWPATLGRATWITRPDSAARVSAPRWTRTGPPVRRATKSIAAPRIAQPARSALRNFTARRSG